MTHKYLVHISWVWWVPWRISFSLRGLELINWKSQCCHFRFKWNCDDGGDKEQIEIRTDNIVYDGNDLEFGIWNDDGYLFLWEMGPDFFRTPHTSEQIRVLVNDYPAWCSSIGMWIYFNFWPQFDLKPFYLNKLAISYCIFLLIPYCNNITHC